jgi:hippurate hydrolase
MYKKELLNKANGYGDKLVKDRRFLHAHPGCGFEINETFEYVKGELEDMGYTPVKCGRAGLVATVGGKKPGKVFLLRADMDGLPIKEESGVDFASENGRMHACGHDMHTAMLLGAARLLKDMENEIYGTVKLMFQPAEEIFEGSKDMLESGLLDSPKVDAALMIHVMAGLPIPAGTVIVSPPGVSAPAADYFEIRIQGKGCHGSMPNNGVDPINVAAHIITALQEINARELALNDRAVLTIGTINAGSAANAIADTATLGGTIRTYDEDTRSFIKKRMEEITSGIAAAFRAEADVVWGSGCPTLVNDAGLSESMYEYVRALLGEEKALSAAKLKNSAGGGSAGSEDFAYVSHNVPSIMLALAAGEPDKGYKYPQHHPMVRIDESVLPVGSAVYAYTAMKFLEENML